MTPLFHQGSVNIDHSERFISRVLTKLNSLWVSATFPFAGRGRSLSLHYASDISRRLAARILLGNRVEIGKHTWLSTGSEDNNELQVTIEVSAAPDTKLPIFIMEAGSGLQRRGMISARTRIHIMKEAIFWFCCSHHGPWPRTASG